MPPTPLSALPTNTQTPLSATDGHSTRNNLIILAYVLAAGSLPVGLGIAILARSTYHYLKSSRDNEDIEHGDGLLNITAAERRSAALERIRRMGRMTAWNDWEMPGFVRRPAVTGRAGVDDRGNDDGWVEQRLTGGEETMSSIGKSEEGLGVYIVDVDLGDENGRWSSNYRSG
ncbi:MAG: hypothetical protein Q9218_008048 [Villophora microphyllina]